MKAVVESTLYAGSNYEQIGRIHLPEARAKLYFRGARGNRRFMAASTPIFALKVNDGGAQWP